MGIGSKPIRRADARHSSHCRGLLRLKTIHWIVLCSMDRAPAMKGYEDGLAAFWTDDSVLLSVSCRPLQAMTWWKHP